MVCHGIGKFKKWNRDNPFFNFIFMKNIDTNFMITMTIFNRIKINSVEWNELTVFYSF